MHWSCVLPALAILATPWTDVHAQQASFDCLQARAPIEMLICSDPRLLQLDGALGDAFAAQRRRLPAAQREAALAEQRTWLAGRLSRCDVPAKGDAVALETRWRAAPCLEEMYRARLAALGGATEPPAAVPERTPGFIHPACLWSLVEQGSEPAEAAPANPVRIPLVACARGNRHIPVDDDEAVGFSAPAASDGVATWLAYRPVGDLSDGREVTLVVYNSGGTGQFSELYVLRRTPSADGREISLTGELVGGGGDRCNGGIEAATLVDPRTVEVDYRVTPLDLLSEADETLADANVERLALCAICCTGTVRRRLDLASRQETTVSATVDQLLSQETDGGSSDAAQTCFDDIVGKAAGPLPHTFTAGELKALAQTFAKTCMPARGPKGAR